MLYLKCSSFNPGSMTIEQYIDWINTRLKTGISCEHSYRGDHPLHLFETFDKIYILDLHGNAKKKETAPDGGKDENVFDISFNHREHGGYAKEHRSIRFQLFISVNSESPLSTLWLNNSRTSCSTNRCRNSNQNAD